MTKLKRKIWLTIFSLIPFTIGIVALYPVVGWRGIAGVMMLIWAHNIERHL